MKIFRARSFTADRAWAAVDIANMDGITKRLHGTDRPYRRHVNDGEAVFAALDGRVERKVDGDGVEHSTALETGDGFHATVGAEHVAHPPGEARILVVEREGGA